MNTPADEPALVDFEAVAKSLNGFDEIAIEAAFHRPFRKMDTGTMMARAILFTVYRREGTKDADAYRRAMLLNIEELAATFTDMDDDLEDDEGKSSTPTG